MTRASSPLSAGDASPPQITLTRSSSPRYTPFKDAQWLTSQRKCLIALLIISAITSITMQLENPLQRKPIFRINNSSIDFVYGASVFDGVKARAFESWPSDRPLPCFEPEHNLLHSSTEELKAPAQKGFLFLKPYKTGSSTTSGINLRIARDLAIRTGLKGKICNAKFDHGPWHSPAAKMFGDRDPLESFLWTVIREPTARAISQFFHMEVSRAKVEPTDANFQNFLLENQDSTHDYYMQCLSLKEYDPNTDNAVDAANEIINEYNFVGVTERMDETAVVLMMLLGLKMADVLYLTSKSAGGYDAGGLEGRCTYIWPSFVSEGMERFFKSPTWDEYVKVDRALHQAANRSLDLTIDRLGRDKFKLNLALFQKARRLVVHRCAATTIFPCDRKSGAKANPNATGCIWKDSGCGFRCMDKIATELGLW